MNAALTHGRSPMESSAWLEDQVTYENKTSELIAEIDAVFTKYEKLLPPHEFDAVLALREGEIYDRTMICRLRLRYTVAMAMRQGF
jgi:hypothetical protein